MRSDAGNARVVVKDLTVWSTPNHHIYAQEQMLYEVRFMRDSDVYRRHFTLLKDALDYRDAALKVSPTPKSRGHARGGNTKPWHDLFCVHMVYLRCYRVILQTEAGKIRKSFADLEAARKWRDDEVRRRGVVETKRLWAPHLQSYSHISDKSEVFADSDNIRDCLDNLILTTFEELKGGSACQALC